MKVVVTDGVGEEVVNDQDPKLAQMEAAYPGQGVATFVLSVWQELQRFNPSGGYTVEIPWHNKEERELTPAEVTDVLMRGKGKGGKGRRGRR